MNLMKSLKEKKAMIDFSKSSDEATVEKKAETSTAYSPVAIAKNANQQRLEMIKENDTLKEQIKEWESCKKAVLINTEEIRFSKWANRNADSFKTPEYFSLLSEIANAGGNVQPIKVRLIADKQSPGDDKIKYEIVFGHRRYQACKENELPVLALVDQLDDAQLFAQMDRENRDRADLRPFEQGAMYKHALSEGLYPSLRKLAESLGVDPSQVSKTLKIVNLPSEILDAFPSKIDIQYRWGALLEDALNENKEIVLLESQHIKEELAAGKKMASAHIFKRLVNASKQKSVTYDIGKQPNSKFNLLVERKNNTTSFVLTDATSEQAEAIEMFIRSLFAKGGGNS